MNYMDLERDLEKLKNQIPINSELKQNLRKSFIIRRRNAWIKRISAVAAALIIVFTAVLLPNNLMTKKAGASAFKISNQISYAEVSSGNGTQINEYNGIQYITVYEKGIYRYDSTGYHIIYEGELSSARLSNDGRRFIISSNGNIILYNIEANEKTEILRGDNVNIYMEEPSWVDENHILYTKKVIEAAEPHGFTVKESSIYSMDINSRNSEKIADGSNASYVSGRNAVVFERDNKIIYRNLKDGVERIVDDGRFPDVSKDGKYIAYVKNESSVKKLTETASLSTTLSNVWITDTDDFKLRQQVTFNFVNKYIDENDWLKSIEGKGDKSAPMQLEFSGRYDYYNPLWSRDSRSLFVIKFTSSEEGEGSKIVRIDFTDDNLSRVDTVKRYIQALIVRDDDYARSLMKNPPEILTISNPRQSGYNILSEGKDDEGNYVEGEVYFQYTGTPYYSIEKSKYYLSKSERGYLIDNIKLQSRTEIYFKNGAMYIKNDDAEQKLFNEYDIPSEYYSTGKSHIMSAAYNAKTNIIIFTSYNNQNNEAGISVIEYNIDNQEFSLIDKLQKIDNQKALGTSALLLEPSGKYAAVSVYYGEPENIRNTVAIYNIENNQKISISNIIEEDFDSLYISFWEEGRLIFTGVKNNEEVKYKYDPEKQLLTSF